MPRAKQPSAELSRAIKRAERAIAREWKHAEPEMKRLVREGRYEQERMFRWQVVLRVEQIRREIIEYKLSLPPFTTFEGGFYYRHPVTPLNVHLLK